MNKLILSTLALFTLGYNALSFAPALEIKNKTNQQIRIELEFYDLPDLTWKNRTYRIPSNDVLKRGVSSEIGFNYFSGRSGKIRNIKIYNDNTGKRLRVYSRKAYKEWLLWLHPTISCRGPINKLSDIELPEFFWYTLYDPSFIGEKANTDGDYTDKQWRNLKDALGNNQTCPLKGGGDSVYYRKDGLGITETKIKKSKTNIYFGK